MRRKGDGRGEGKRLRIGILLGMLGLLAALSGSPALGQPPDDWKEGIAYDVPPSAKITKVGFSMGNTESGVMLIYEVGIRNVSEKAIRFKLTIFPLEGDPVSGTYPLLERKGKPLALEPKEEMIQKWPIFAKELPKGFALVVKEVEE
jgi:hypothetical protein